ncbi:MAG: acetyl-CoA carboxylase biotin carboxyl carrier protein subunit, partial [Saccharofermentans sp.]|nr:acetyl-CoA carboxylase biotin carboxyl carrier protein subunit [Saccharofermentans sp.]
PAPAAPAAAAAAGTTPVNAPMPGTILDVKVAVGQAVKEGELVCILEAMKMENEIYAPCAGTVAQVLTSKGASVDTGTPLVTIS